MRFVRFLLDHDQQTALVLNTGPQEAVHSTANGCWVLADIQPFQDFYRLDGLAGLSLLLIGHPFNGNVSYEIVTVNVETGEIVRV